MRQSQSGSGIALGGGIAFRAATKFPGWHCLGVLVWRMVFNANIMAWRMSFQEYSAGGSLGTHPPQLKKPFSNTWRRNLALAEYEPQHTPANKRQSRHKRQRQRRLRPQHNHLHNHVKHKPVTTPPQHKNSAPMPNYDPSKSGHLYLSNPLAGNRGFSSVTAGKQTQSPVAPNTK